MNVTMTRSEYEGLPFRDDLEHDPLPGKRYRSRGRDNMVFEPYFPKNDQRIAGWDAYGVTITDG